MPNSMMLKAVAIVLGFGATASGANSPDHENRSFANGGKMVFSAKGLPPGLVISQNTGAISGSISRKADWKVGDVFRVVVKFHNGDGASGMTKIDIQPQNASPTAMDDALILPNEPGAAIRITALENDFDADGDSLNIVSARPKHGTIVTWDRGMLFLPNGNGDADEILYQIEDGHGGVATAKVRVTFR